MAQQADNPLTRDAIKVEVLLLTQPTLPLSQPVLAHGDVPELFLGEHESRRRTMLPPAETVGLSDAMYLGSVTAVFVGQKLQCYCSVRNAAPVDINRVKVTVELEMPLARNQPAGAKKVVEQLGTRPITIDRIGPAETFGFIVPVTIKAEGRHAIVCRIQYNEIKHLGAKVTPPVFLEAKRALHVTFSENFLKEDDLLLEALIENTTGGALRIDSVRLDAHSFLQCEDLNGDPFAFGGYADIEEPVGSPEAAAAASASASGPAAAGTVWKPPLQQSAHMGMSDKRQYLFRLRAVPGSGTRLSEVAYVGDLKVDWATGFSEVPRKGGERSWRALSAVTGSIKYEIQREQAPTPLIVITVTAMPCSVKAEVPFPVVLTLTNKGMGASALHLRVAADRVETDLLLADVAGTMMAVVPPGATISGVVVHLVALKTGVQRISGILLADAAGEYPINFPEVYVDVGGM